MHELDALLQQMVRIDSVNAASSGNMRAEDAIGGFLEETARGWGIAVDRLAVPERSDNLLLTVRASQNADAAPWLLFDSHMDTVSVENMTIEPFGGRIEDGKLFGRGACDTKGTGAAMLWALKEYAAATDRPNNVALLFTVDEEVTLSGARTFARQHLPQLGITFAGVIVGEPTLLRPVIAHNGVVRWTITTTGVAAHAAAPELGKSAIRMMTRVLAALEANYIDQLEGENPLTGRNVCSATTIHGGTQVNIIPDRCDITIDHRFIPGLTADACIRNIQAVLDNLTSHQPWIKVHQHGAYGAPALDPGVSRDWLPVVERVLARHGFTDAPIGAPFATNAGDYAEVGLPVIVLGPGDATPAHTRDEWVELAQIHRGAAVYGDLMRESPGTAVRALE